MTDLAPLFVRILDDLARQGWTVQPLALPAPLSAALAEECRRRHAAGELSRAAIGRGNGQQLDEGIRGDHIQWLNPGEGAVIGPSPHTSRRDGTGSAVGHGRDPSGDSPARSTRRRGP